MKNIDMQTEDVSKDPIVILGIESSCDDTSASVCRDGVILSNIIYSQKIHEEFGGVVPELASRKHEQKIVPVVEMAIADSGIQKSQISAVAFTRGPGLIGSLMVGVSFAKGMALALNRPLIAVNHMQAHVLSNFIEDPKPEFPFVCFTVSGGHTQLVLVRDYLDMEVLGTTIDDAAGEAFDKAAKMLGLEYPGGPGIDRLGQEGNAHRFVFSKPTVSDYNFSFSGLKTSILYFLQKETAKDAEFIQKNLSDLCASIQNTIIEILMSKLEKVLKSYNVRALAIAGGVSANSGFRRAIGEIGIKYQLPISIPSIRYCTDNAAMIALTGYYKFLKGEFSSQDIEPLVKGYRI